MFRLITVIFLGAPLGLSAVKEVKADHKYRSRCDDILNKRRYLVHSLKELTEKITPEHLDRYYTDWRNKAGIPLYGDHVPLIMNLLTGTDLTENEIEFQRWLFKNTKKLRSCLTFVCLYNPLLLAKLDSESICLERYMNEEAEDVSLTPLFAWFTSIDSIFKVDGYSTTVAKYLEALIKKIPPHFDIYRKAKKYRLKSSPPYRLWKDNQKICVADYCRQWGKIEDTTNVIKDLIRQLGDQLAKSNEETIARHFGAGFDHKLVRDGAIRTSFADITIMPSDKVDASGSYPFIGAKLDPTPCNNVDTFLAMLKNRGIKGKFKKKIHRFCIQGDGMVPLYGRKMPLAASLLLSRNLDPIILEKHLVKKPKLCSSLVFGFLYNPLRLLENLQSESKCLSLMNKNGEDISWTPGFAFVKNINFQLKALNHVRDDNCLRRCLESLLKMVSKGYIDIHKEVRNYSLPNSSGFWLLPQKLTGPKRTSFTTIAHYLDKWHDKYYEQVSKEGQSLLEQLYNLVKVLKQSVVE